jgi:hypothetical protein
MGALHMFRTFAPVALAAAFCFATATASAEHSADAESACTPDVFRLCSAQIPSQGKIVACLRMNKTKLSPACRKVFS